MMVLDHTSSVIVSIFMYMYFECHAYDEKSMKRGYRPSPKFATASANLIEQHTTYFNEDRDHFPSVQMKCITKCWLNDETARDNFLVTSYDWSKAENEVEPEGTYFCCKTCPASNYIFNQKGHACKYNQLTRKHDDCCCHVPNGKIYNSFCPYEKCQN